MKLTNIIALFTLITMVKGLWWAAAVQPVILSLGAILGAIELDLLNNVELIELRSILPFINKHEKNKPKIEYKEDDETDYTFDPITKEQQDRIDKHNKEAEESLPDNVPKKKKVYGEKGEIREKAYWKRKLQNSM